MIKLLRGLWTDGNKEEQPEGTYRNADHLVFDKSKNIPSKQLGTSEYSSDLPSNKYLIGSIEIDDDIIVLLQDSISTNDEIGIIDTSGKYKNLLTSNLEFDINYPAKIKYIKNANNQRIIIWTDEINKLRFFNIDSINTSSFDNKRLEVMSPEFGYPRPDFNSSSIHFLVKKGGFLKTGSYIPIFRYRTEEEVTTNWIMPAEVLHVSAMKADFDSIAGTPNINSGKQIELNFPVIDSNFKFVEIGAIASIDGNITARFLFQKETQDFSTYTISNYEDVGEALELSEVISPKVNYNSVRDIEIHNDELILAGCKDQYPINYQKYANNILISYDVSYRVTYNYDTSVAANDGVIQKGFYPGEVYAFYIVFEYKDGSLSSAFHIPGRAAVAGDTSTSIYNSDFSNTSFTVKNFHVEDTSGKTGVGAATNMGYWENDNEKYPNTDDFDSTSVGGSDLRNQPVRHHRFPSIRKLKASGSSLYGKTELPLLKIDVSNVVIPSNITDKVKAWRIYYAKPTIKNMTCLGTSIPVPQGEYINATGDNDDNKNKLISIAQNCEKGTGATRVISSANNIRFYSPDLLINKPQISPAFIYPEFEISTTNIPITTSPSGINNPSAYTSGSFKNELTGGSGGKARLIITRTDSNTSINNVTSSEEVIVVEDHKYIPVNSIIGDIDNRVGEEHLHLKLKDDLPNYNSAPRAIFDGRTHFDDVTYLVTLKQLPADVYHNFYEQTNLVALDDDQQITSSGTKSDFSLGGGDSSPNLDSHITTAGVHGGDFLTPYIDVNNPSYIGLGHLVIHHFSNYSRTLLIRRYMEEGNAQTYFVPLKSAASSMIFENYDPTLAFEYKYSSDYSLLNEINSVIPFNPYNRTVIDYPHRVHRSGKINRSIIDITFDFIEDDISVFEMPKDKGIITGLFSFDNRLVIKHEKTAYVTAPPQRFKNTEGQEFGVENSDLFDLRPVELITTDKGFVGSNSKFSSFVSEFGVIMIDENRGRIFLLSNNFGLEEISKEGMYNYFKDNLKSYNKYAYDSYSSITTDKWKGNKRYFIFTLSSINVNQFKISDYIYSSTDNNTGKIIDINQIDNQLYVYTDLEDASATTSHNIVHIKNVDSPFNVGGIILGYDTRNQIFLITKNDLKGLSDIDKENFKGFYSENNITNGIYLIGDQYVRYNGSTFDNVNNINNSFTISYYPNPNKKFWGSFHSKFIPNLYIPTQNKILVVENINDPIVYEYNILSNIGNAFGETYDLLLEIIHNEGEMIPKKYIGINWDVRMYDTDNVFLSDNTFDTILLSNSYQSISENTLTIFTNLASPGNIRNIKNIWRFSRLRTDNIQISDRKYLTDNYLSVIFRETSANQLFIHWFDFEFNIINKR